MPIAGETEISAITKDPQALIRVPVGAMSPLWGLFAGAAVSGAAWWWMTRWARPANLEAVFGAAEAATVEVETAVEALAAPVVEAIEAAPAVIEAAAQPRLDVIEEAPALMEAAAEPALDAVAEAPAAIEPVVEAATETVEAFAEETVPAPIADDLIDLAPEPVGGESAPISPVLEAMSPEIVAKAAPKPKKPTPKSAPTAE